MPTQVSIPGLKPKARYPAEVVEQWLRIELEKAGSDSLVLGGGWGPELDSLQVVSVVLVLEKIVGFKLAPEKLVRRGGYRSVEEGVADVSARLKQAWDREQRARKGRS